MTSRLLRSTVAAAAVALAVLGAVTAGGSPAGASTRAAIRTATAAPNCGPSVRKNLFSSWKCTFADDFDGTALDPTKWTAVTSAGSGLTSGPGCYVDSPGNIAVYGGALHLTARQEAQPFTCSTPKGSFSTTYSSGQVATYGHFFQTYGRVSVRAAFPAATVAGLQSTLWLWPENPAAYGTVGEIDFAEWYSSTADRVIPYVHYLYDPGSTNLLTGSNVVTNNDCVIGDASAFHEYVSEWTSSTVTVKIDGRTCLTDHYHAVGPNPFAQPYFVALTQALGIGNNAFAPGSTPLPATTSIDWVRVWK
jgi:beta-glucanase (GH16 family)